MVKSLCPECSTFHGPDEPCPLPELCVVCDVEPAAPGSKRCIGCEEERIDKDHTEQ